ncbi:MAG: hypothetical protein AAGG48_08135 [Planctomycetota bacterium]
MSRTDPLSMDRVSDDRETDGCASALRRDQLADANGYALNPLGAGGRYHQCERARE